MFVGQENPNADGINTRKVLAVWIEFEVLFMDLKGIVAPNNEVKFNSTKKGIFVLLPTGVGLVNLSVLFLQRDQSQATSRVMLQSVESPKLYRVLLVRGECTQNWGRTNG